MFSKKNAGGFFLFIDSLLMLLLSVFYFVDPFKDFMTHILVTGIVLMVSGIACFAAFLNNQRAYFRPGWILSQSFVQIILGFYILFNRLITSYDSYFIIFGLWALFTGLTQIAVSIQIKALDIVRWFYVILMGIINLILGFLTMLNIIKIYDMLYIYTGIYFLTLSMSYIMEFFVYRKGSA